MGQDLRDLAAQGGAAAPEFTRLADEMAAAAVNTLALRDAEAAIAKDVKATKQALNEKRDALARLRAVSQGASTDTQEYRDRVVQARLAIIEERAALRAKQEALREAAALARAAATAEKALADQARASATTHAAATKTTSNGLKELGTQLTQVQRAVLAVTGGTVLTQAIGDIGRTADAYNNLAARIRIVTGEGAVFQEAFQGVQDIAIRTGTTLDSTATLFSRIAQAGKSLGIANAEALALTETIGQAIQVSGASAQSADAALVQLVQGLQSGVLRGEEFNSVMEQAPRLARTLSDGLGVTTGELRAMAQAGKLSSETVIRALQGQAQVLQTEFAQLPPTIGRALTNLSTAWTQYIGEADAATGVSASAARAITALAQNLDTAAGFLIGAGKAAAAYKAVQLAQSFLSQSAAVTAQTTAIASNTAATVANTTAKRANAAATVASGEAATVASGRFAALAANLKLAALVTVVTNLKEIGTAVGEGTARFFGYGKAIDALEESLRREEAATRANAAAKAALAQQLRLTEDRSLGLSKESRKLVDEFEGMRLKGESTSESLAKLEKNLHLDDISGIAAAGAALDALGRKGELSANQIRDAFTRSLAGVDLGVFTTQARAAFDNSEQGAKRFASAMDGAVREAIRRTGGDFQLLSGGIGAAAQSSINDLDLLVGQLGKLKAAGINTAQVLTLSIGKAIDTADSQKALDAVRVQVERVRAALGDKVADGFLDQLKVKADALRDSLDSLTPGVNSLREAYRQLGVAAPADMARVADANRAAWNTIRTDASASADVLRQAFERYAQSALAASGQTGRASREVTQEMLEAEAAAKGLSVEFDTTGRMIVQRAGESAAAIDRTTGAIQRQTRALQEQQQLTSDGLATNGDGSARGTFGNTLPVDVANNIAQKRARGQLTADDLPDALNAVQQARSQREWLDSVSPGFVSTGALRGATALQTATEEALRAVQALRGAAGMSNNSGRSHNVTVNLGGRSTTFGMASQQDAQNFEGLLRTLETAAGASF